CRCASGNPAFRRSETPRILAARAASSARSDALPRVPASPAVRSRIPTLYPASTAFRRVPAQVSSTSSRWAARARMSTGIVEYRAERAEKAERTERAEKAEKAEKVEKAVKADNDN